MNSQLKKGVLEICVLALLQKRDFYGYELVEEIAQFMEITEGTIYPLLRRMKDTNMVDTYLVESSSGPPRKYYKLTDKGREESKLQVQEYFAFTEGIRSLLKGALS